MSAGPILLALNTAQNTHELALLKGQELLAERRWENAKEDVEKLVPTVEELLLEAGLKKQELTNLLCVVGPGSFTSVRVGVAFMNALAEGLKIPLFGVDTFELLRMKAGLPKALVLLPAGGLDVGLSDQGEIKVGSLAPLLAKIPHGPQVTLVAELPETLSKEFHPIVQEKSWTLLLSSELKTLGQSLAALGSFPFKAQKMLEALYLRGAHITVSKDPWKQAR